MIKKKRVVLFGIVAILIIALSVFLSGCTFAYIYLDVYCRKPSSESVFGIPTGYYILLDKDIKSRNANFGMIYIDNNISNDFEIEFIETYMDKYPYNIYQGEDGQICLGKEDVDIEKRILLKYFHEKNILEIHYPYEVLHYKREKTNNLENYGIPKGTYNLVQEELSENNEILTELIVDDGVEFGENKYIFSQDEDGKIYMSTNETMNDKKQIIYFYEEKLLEVRWNDNLVLQFKQEEIQDEINKE